MHKNPKILHCTSFCISENRKRNKNRSSPSFLKFRIEYDSDKRVKSKFLFKQNKDFEFEQTIHIWSKRRKVTFRPNLIEISWVGREREGLDQPVKILPGRL